MKQVLYTTLLVSALGAGTAVAADKCDVPKAEWQPVETLQEKLQAEGWEVKRVKEDDGCYEVYGKNPDGKRAEVYFNPKTFDVVSSKLED